MRPVDPLQVILCCYAILTLRGQAGKGTERATAAQANGAAKA
jgi:hypothetical protein